MATMFDPLKSFNEMTPELSALSRQQKMADLLTARGMQSPQGQTINGVYVPTNPFEFAGNLYSLYAGKQMGENIEQKQLDLAKALRKRQSQEIEQFGELMKTDPAAAYRLAAQSYVPELRATGVKRMLPEEVTLGEGQKRIMVMPDGTVKEIAKGEEKYKAPIQIDTGTSQILLDPKTLQPVGQFGKSTAGQVVEREDGTFLVDTRTGAARPVTGPQGQPLIGGKPLTETQSNAVAFGMRAVEANKLATDLESKGFTNTGVIRTAVGGTMGQAPIVGGKLEQGVRSAFNVLPEFAGGPSPEQQQVDQARRNFISAVLRKESGAAIGVEEYSN